VSNKPLRWIGIAGVVALFLMSGAVALSASRGSQANPPASQSTNDTGLSRDQAVALARSGFGDTEVSIGSLRWARSGTFSSLASSDMQAANVAPNRLVWAISFNATGLTCPPDGSTPCWTTQPGEITVFLDYHTGESLAGEGLYPAPS